MQASNITVYAVHVRKKIALLSTALLITALLALLGAFGSLYASAADGSAATGAQLPDYNSGIEVSVSDYKADNSGEKDSASAIQKALNVGRDKATDTNQVVVTVPAGTYKISKSLKIYSNTRLVLDDGATIVKCFDSGCMLRNILDMGGGGYGASRNIVIEGGTWDGNTAEYSNVYSFSNIRIAHANNVVLKNMTVLNNKNGHHFEIGGVQKLTVDGCSFSGYTGSLLKEAIQLDVMNCNELFAEYSPFDDTPCDNVLIQNCSFNNLPRAIGSHSAVVGTYYTNVTIRNNTFDNITNICMVLYNYKQCTISGNKITNSGAGITFNYMSDENFRHYFRPTIGNAAAKAHISDNADTVIENNSITTVQTTLQLNPYGIKLYGKNVSSGVSDYPAYNYRISNVKIDSNTISTAGSAITMQNVYGSSIKDNDISVNGDTGSLDADLVTASYCSDIGFRNNTVSGSNQSGLRAKNVSEFTVSGNSFSDNSVCAAVLNYASDSTVSKNSILNSGKGGLKISDGCTGITVSGNVVKKSSSYGIQISAAGSESDDITVKSNDISGGNVGISCVNDGKAYLTGNSFEAVEDKVYADSDGMITLAEAKNFTAEEVTENRIKLTWNAISEADGINVYRRKAGMEDFELIATLDSGAIFQDEKLISGTNYFYKIVPYLTIGDENCDNTVSQEITARTKISIETAYIDCVDSAGFTARPVTPKITIVANNRELVPGADYDYSYSDNLYTGTATITVTGKGNYIGTLTHNFEITLTDRAVSNVSARQTAAVPVFSTERRVSYQVECKPASGMLLADSDETVNPILRSINAMRVQVPVEISVTTAIWSDDSCQYFTL